MSSARARMVMIGLAATLPWVFRMCLAVAPALAEEERLYAPPAPGTYELPVIDRISEHWLLDSQGERAPLLGLEPGQVALVSPIYGSCGDARGCPLALAVLQRVDRALAEDSSLALHTRLVTFSFDPGRDHPAQMRELREHMSPRTDWRFLTASSLDAIQPVLADLGQDVTPLIDQQGEPTGWLRHVMKVFLVDHTGAVRNVYSAGLFDDELVLNDLRTLVEAAGRDVIEEPPQPER